MTAARAIQRPVLAAHRLRGRGPLVDVGRRGIHWELDLREGIDFSIWLLGYFEPSTVAAYRRLVSPGATVVDIGANIGAHTLHLARAVGPQGRVIAFEPSADAFGRLARNIALNPGLQDRISLHQTMLLASDDALLPATVVSSWPLLPRSELDPVAPGRAQPTSGATAARRDDALEALGVTTVDVVKLDVDGYELDVLQGAPRLLDEARPAILFELAPSVLDGLGQRLEDLLELLTIRCYRVSPLRGDDEVTPDVIAALRRARASMNVLAVPRS
jgi:FkbM family methyltransferase